MTIYDLLKNSSPSMAKHFMDSENGIKELKNRVTALEGGKNNVLIIKKEGVTGDTIREGESVTFTTDNFDYGDSISLTDAMEKHIMKDIDIIVFYRSSNVPITYLKIATDFSTKIAIFASLHDIKNDFIKVSNHTLTRIFSKNSDEPIVYEKVITGNSQFSVRDRVVGNETKQEYYIIKKIDPEHGKLHKHNPNFTPHACIYTCENNTDGTIKTAHYVEIPIMDDYNILRTRDVAGISIGRSYDKNQYLTEIIITVTESIYLGLGNETIESIIVYL